jgi:hypothetical protein
MIDIQVLPTWPSVGQERDNVNLSFKSLGAQSAIELDLAGPHSRKLFRRETRSLDEGRMLYLRSRSWIAVGRPCSASVKQSSPTVHLKLATLLASGEQPSRYTCGL